MKECCRCAYYQTVSRWIALPRQWLVRVVETARVQTSGRGTAQGRAAEEYAPHPLRFLAM